MREAFLDALPPDAPGQMSELREYRFVDATAQRLFDELQEHVREQVMSSYFRQMAEGMRAMTPEDIARFKDMLAELNGLIEMRERGRIRRRPSKDSWNDTATCSPTIRRPSTSCSKTWPVAWRR